MDSMDEVLSFLDRLLELEFEAEHGTFTDDAATLTPKLNAVNALFADEVRLGSAIVAGPATPQRRAESAAMVPEMKPRKVFAVKEYTHRELGTVYAAFLGGKYPWMANTLDVVYFIRKHPTEYRVVSTYRGCIDCNTTGEIGGRPCSTCNGLGWDHLDGIAMSDPGPLTATRFVQDPDDEQQKQLLHRE